MRVTIPSPSEGNVWKKARKVRVVQSEVHDTRAVFFGAGEGDEGAHFVRPRFQHGGASISQLYDNEQVVPPFWTSVVPSVKCRLRKMDLSPKRACSGWSLLFCERMARNKFYPETTKGKGNHPWSQIEVCFGVIGKAFPLIRSKTG